MGTGGRFRHSKGRPSGVPGGGPSCQPVGGSPVAPVAAVSDRLGETSGRSAAIFPARMERGHEGPMDLAGSQGCGVGSDHGPRADPLPAEAAFVRRAYGGPVAGSGELGGEGGRRSAVGIIQPQLHERAIRHPQSGWTASSRNRPQGSEHFSSTSSLQDGGHPSAAGPSATGRFHDEGGLKGRLPDGPHGEVSPTPSGIQVAGSALPLQSPPLWPCTGATDFHEAAAPSGGSPAANGVSG